MGGEWSETTLGDLIDIKHGFAFKGQLIYDEPRGDLLLTPGNFAVRGGFKGDKFKYYDGPVSEEFVLRKGDLLVTMTDLSKQSDTLGYPAFVPAYSDGRRCLHNQRLGKVTPKEIADIDLRYIYYVMCGKEYHQEVLASATGTTVKHTSPERLRRFRFLIPPLPEQRAIAHILGTLDDKIELNRRMNETLEAMARALFKDWFVDFGPTRAKIEGRDPYLAPETWGLFPDKLDEDGKPEGWEYGRLADIADSPSRGVRPSEVSEDTPYIGLGHMPRRSVALTEWEGAGKVTSNKYVFKRGEFLFGKLRPYFHKVGIAPIDGICSTDIIVIAPRAPHWNSLTLACISTDDFVDYTNTTSTGTKMPRTSWKTMGQYELCFSTVQVAQAFEVSIGLLTTRIVSNIRECKALSQSRDLLLPKLMSGEIRAGDTDEIVLEST